MVIVLTDYHLNIEPLVVTMSTASVINSEHFQSLLVHSLKQFLGGMTRIFNCIIYIHIFSFRLLLSMIFVVDHSVPTIEIDKDRNSIVQSNDDNNIVAEYEHAVNMLLYSIHRLIMTNAKGRNNYRDTKKSRVSINYVVQTGTRHLNYWNKNIQLQGKLQQKK